MCCACCRRRWQQQNVTPLMGNSDRPPCSQHLQPISALVSLLTRAQEPAGLQALAARDHWPLPACPHGCSPMPGRRGGHRARAAALSALLLLLLLAGAARALRPLPAGGEAALQRGRDEREEELNLRPLIGIVSQVRAQADPVAAHGCGRRQQRSRRHRATAQPLRLPTA